MSKKYKLRRLNNELFDLIDSGLDIQLEGLDDAVRITIPTAKIVQMPAYISGNLLANYKLVLSDEVGFLRISDYGRL